MDKLIIPEDYDILNAWVNNINENDSEMENMPVGFKRNNKNIIGYMVVDRSQKHSCIGDGIIQNGKDEKPWIESNGIFGAGMYFYEYNYRYALDVAKSKKLDIVGAVISVENVLDFTDGFAISLINEKKESFNTYLNKLVQKYQEKISTLKNQNSETYKKYSNEIQRIASKNVDITDYLNFLDTLGKKEKKYKYDAIRYISSEYNIYLGIPFYQATIMCLRNQKKVVEYFNPNNAQEREYIERKYFKEKSK